MPIHGFWVEAFSQINSREIHGTIFAVTAVLCSFGCDIDDGECGRVRDEQSKFWGVFLVC